MNTFETITCEVSGHVATVTLNRPDVRNAMSNRMVEELLACFRELSGDDHRDVRVAMIQAAGTVFCSGGDVRDLSATGAMEDSAAAARLDELLRAVNEAPQVVVCRVQGAALGAGLASSASRISPLPPQAPASDSQKCDSASSPRSSRPTS